MANRTKLHLSTTHNLTVKEQGPEGWQFHRVCGEFTISHSKLLFLFWSWQKGFFCKSSNMIWQLVFVIFHLLAESVFNTRLWMEEAILEFPATCGFWFEEDGFQRKSHIHYKSQRRRRSMTRPSDTCQPYPKDLATSHFGRRLPVPGDDSLPNKSANDLSNCDLVKLQMIIRIIWSFCAHQCKTVDQGSLTLRSPGQNRMR